MEFPGWPGRCYPWACRRSLHHPVESTWTSLGRDLQRKATEGFKEDNVPSRDISFQLASVPSSHKAFLAHRYHRYLSSEHLRVPRAQSRTVRCDSRQTTGLQEWLLLPHRRSRLCAIPRNGRWHYGIEDMERVRMSLVPILGRIQLRAIECVTRLLQRAY